MGKGIIVSAIVIIAVAIIFSFDGKVEAHTPVRFYNRNGEIFKLSKIFVDTVQVTTGNGFSINLSAAGFTTIAAAYATVISNTSNQDEVPFAEIKTISTTACVINIMEGNEGVLGILNGVEFLQSTTGVMVAICILGN